MTIPIHPQYLTDADGKKLSVVLSLEEYQAILEELDMHEDIQRYLKVKESNEPFSNADEVYARIEAQRKCE